MKKNAIRLAFVLPALLAAAPATAEPARKPAAKIHYVTLDKMIRAFAAEARAQQASRAAKPAATVLAQR